MIFLLRLIQLALLAGLLWAGGLLWYLQIIPTTPSSDATQTDAIVVLTGGKQRIDYGLKLLSEGKAKRMFISGVGKGVSLPELVASSPSSALFMHLLNDNSVIVLGHEASDTRGNARETAEWVQKERYTSLRLVTANYHIPRSLLEFNRAMPSVAVIADAAQPDDFQRYNWWKDERTRQLLISEYHKYMLSFADHLLRLLLG